MNTRLLVWTLLALTTAPVLAQPERGPVAPGQPAPNVVPPAQAPAQVQAAPAQAAPAQPGPAPQPPPNPVGPQPPAPPIMVPLSQGPATAAPPPVAGEVYRPWPTPSAAPLPAAPRYQFAPPRLYPIRPQPQRKRHYGDAGGPFALGIGGSVLWRNDRAYQLFTSEGSSAAFELFASYDVLTLFKGAIVSAGVSYRNELLSGDQNLDLRHSTAQAELMARFQAAGWLWPHLRAAVGVVSTRFSYRDERARIDYDDRDAGLASTFGAGFTLRTPARLFETFNGRLASLSLGLLVEGGYTLAKAAELEATPSTKSSVPRATFSLGSIERSAPYLRIAGSVRF